MCRVTKSGGWTFVQRLCRNWPVVVCLYKPAPARAFLQPPYVYETNSQRAHRPSTPRTHAPLGNSLQRGAEVSGKTYTASLAGKDFVNPNWDVRTFYKWVPGFDWSDVALKYLALRGLSLYSARTQLLVSILNHDTLSLLLHKRAIRLSYILYEFAHRFYGAEPPKTEKTVRTVGECWV